MKLITFEDIVKLNITPEQCFTWVSDMIEAKRQAELPAKISMHPSEGVFCNVMPCTIPPADMGYSCGGVKVVNRYPNRVPSLDSMLLLLNMDNGEFLSIMDANWITAMRTGSVAVHAIKHLAKSDFKTIAMLGLGNTARATLLTLAHVYKDREFHIKLLKYKNQEELFKQRFQEYKNLKFTYCDSASELITGSDVVISCVTYFDYDFCEDKYFEEGILVIPVHTRGFANCDLFFDKVFADDTNHVNNFKYFNRFKYFAEMCDVVNHVKEGRTSDKERILAYNIGLAIHDINLASHIYQIAMNQTDVKHIEVNPPTEKFWI